MVVDTLDNHGEVTGAAPENLDRVKRYRDQGIARVVTMLPSAPATEILPILDRWAALIRQTAH